MVEKQEGSKGARRRAKSSMRDRRVRERRPKDLGLPISLGGRQEAIGVTRSLLFPC